MEFPCYVPPLLLVANEVALKEDVWFGGQSATQPRSTTFNFYGSATPNWLTRGILVDAAHGYVVSDSFAFSGRVNRAAIATQDSLVQVGWGRSAANPMVHPGFPLTPTDPITSEALSYWYGGGGAGGAIISAAAVLALASGHATVATQVIVTKAAAVMAMSMGHTVPRTVWGMRAQNAMALTPAVGKAYVDHLAQADLSIAMDVDPYTRVWRASKAHNDMAVRIDRDGCRPGPDYGDMDTSVFAGKGGGVCCSADGKHVYQGSGVWRGVFASHDHGWSWERVFLRPQASMYGFKNNLIACSADGSRIICNVNDGYMGYATCAVSEDYGETWTEYGASDPELVSWVNCWRGSFYASRDTMLIAYYQSSYQQVSRDGGLTWETGGSTPGEIQRLAGSADGSVIIAYNSSGDVYASYDQLRTFQLVYGAASARMVYAVNEDGSICYGYDYASGGRWFISYDHGATITPLAGAPSLWQNVRTNPRGNRVYGPVPLQDRFYWSDDYGQTWDSVSTLHGTYDRLYPDDFAVADESPWVFIGSQDAPDPLMRLFLPEWSVTMGVQTSVKAKTEWEFYVGKGHGVNLVVDPQFDDTYMGTNPTALQARAWDGSSYSWSASLAPTVVNDISPHEFPDGVNSCLYFHSYGSPFGGSYNTCYTRPCPIPDHLRGKLVTASVEVMYLQAQDSPDQFIEIALRQWRGLYDHEWQQYAYQRDPEVVIQVGDTGYLWRSDVMPDYAAYPLAWNEWVRYAGIWNATRTAKVGLQLHPHADFVSLEMRGPNGDVDAYVCKPSIDRYYSHADLPYRDGDFSGWAWSGDMDKSYSYGEHYMMPLILMGARAQQGMEFLVYGEATQDIPPTRTTPIKGMWHVGPEVKRTRTAGVMHIAPEVRRK